MMPQKKNRSFTILPANPLPLFLLAFAIACLAPAPYARAADAFDALTAAASGKDAPPAPEPERPATAAAAPTPLSAGRDLVFYVWSDSHFGAYDFSDPLRLTIMDRMNALTGRSYPYPYAGDRVAKPAFLLSCGDITENGAPDSWDAPELGAQRSYVRTIQRLAPGVGTYEALGNHDSRKDANIRGRVAEKQGGTYYSFDKQGVHFAVLDPYPANNTAAPDFDEAQLAWLKADLDALPADTPIILAAHVQPDSEQTALDRTSKPGRASSQALYEAVKGRNVLAFLHGHLHRTGRLNWRGIDVVEPAGFAYPMPNYQASRDAVFGVVRIQDDRITVFSYDWNLDGFSSSPVLLDKTFRVPAEARPAPALYSYSIPPDRANIY
ncbi:MAG TPA: metallophosphoesterase [Elusimicrobiales bacterium]|nr:metallophosphoesterase [Elusimicrobiales bacterium]